VKTLITGMMTLFNTGGDFYDDISGRLFFGNAPEGTDLSEGPFAVFFPVSDTNDDTFSEEMKDVAIQFSLFSGESSPAEILDMDTHLTALYKDKTFTVSDWTVVVMRRLQGSGPFNMPADVEAGTGKYWQTDIDFEITIQQ